VARRARDRQSPDGRQTSCQEQAGAAPVAVGTGPEHHGPTGSGVPKSALEVMCSVRCAALNEQGGPQVHAHVVVGRFDGTAHGGRLLEAHFPPALEVIVVDSPRYLRRKVDSESRLALIRPDD
jgi:hypothetical protein